MQQNRNKFHMTRASIEIKNIEKALKSIFLFTYEIQISLVTNDYTIALPDIELTMILVFFHWLPSTFLKLFAVILIFFLSYNSPYSKLLKEYVITVM